MWLGPPIMRIEIIARALGVWRGGFGCKSKVRVSNSGLAGAASRPSFFNSQVSAVAPKPNVLDWTKWRREQTRLDLACPFISIEKKKAVGAPEP